jgi:replication-associated recombination protein RarA
MLRSDYFQRLTSGVRLQRHSVGQCIMKLILLYGPPAVGKLTIAKEIARLTGFKLFHAHLTSDLV